MEIGILYHARIEGADCRTLGSLTRRVVKEVLAFDHAPPDTEVSVLYTDDNEMRELNRKYRKISRSTDVLSFAMREGKLPPAHVDLLGDVVISLDAARHQARGGKQSLRSEIATLLVHGTLHLLGYDHEAKGGAKARSARARRMRAAHKACLERLQAQLIL